MVKKILLMVAVVAGTMFLMQSAAHSALSVGATYTIEVDAISSAGAVVDLGLSTTKLANADGKISFSFSGLPTRSSYNFLLVTIKDSTDTTVRQAIVPIAASGGTTNLGASPMTDKQTDAMLSAMSTAGSDDPVLVLFGSILIRSGGKTIDDNITHFTAIGLQAIRGGTPYDNSNGGFNCYLSTKITPAQMAAFQSAIVTGLAEYTGTLKQGVDAAESKDKRAKAASLLSKILIDAANAADFDLSYINAAMKAASDKQEDYLMSDAGMAESAVSAMDCVMFANYMKLNAERVRQKYSTALAELDANDTQIGQLNDAVTTLTGKMLTAFEEFEEAFAVEDGELVNDTINGLFEGTEADSGIQDDMNDAFSTFMTDIAASDADITAMVTAMKTGFCSGNHAAQTELNNMKLAGMFTFQDMGGTSMNWPITMVVPVTWVANNHSDDLEYARDDTTSLPIPEAMNWLSTRTNFEGMPTSLASLFELREDIEIIQARKWAGISCASRDMTGKGYYKMSGNDKILATTRRDNGTIAVIGGDNDDDDDDTITEDSGLYLVSTPDFAPLEDLSPYLTGKECQDIEEEFVNRLNVRKGKITATGITDAQKKALIDTAMMPDFH